MDGDGVDDQHDVCPERKDIKTTDFSSLETMDLCEKDKVKSRESFLVFKDGLPTFALLKGTAKQIHVQSQNPCGNRRTKEKKFFKGKTVG